MAKTVKPTKRPSSTKQRKGGLFSKINFKSRKTQFLSVILLVAVMGGGWFTYRSFAAENVSTANVSNGKLTCVSGSAGCSKPSEEAKNNLPVAELSYSGVAYSVNQFFGFDPIPSATDVCFYAKSGGGVVNVRVTDSGASGKLLHENQYTIVGDYKWYCLPTVRTSKSAFGVRVQISSIKNTGNTIRISAIQAKPGVFFQVSQPAPAK
jgi:hypothetical protein